MSNVSSFNPFGPGNDPAQSPPPGQGPGQPPANGGMPGYPGGNQQPPSPARHAQPTPGQPGQWVPNAGAQAQSYEPGRHEAPFNDPLARRPSVGTQPVPGSSITMASPPNGLLIAAAVCALLGGIVGAIGWGRWFSLLGWVLAGPVAMWLVARFVAVDTERKTATVYARPSSTGVFWVVAIVAVVLGIAVTALAVGFWIGQL